MRNNWKNEKEILSKYILEDNLSYEEIGKIYNCTGSNIKKVAKKLGIELPKRRLINDSENFSHVGKSKVNSFTDEEFSKIIFNNVGWKNIDLALGYSGITASNVHANIKDRCLKLGIEPIIEKPSSILLKTKGELENDRKNYQSYRSAIRKSAEIIFKNSNKPRKCSICGYDTHIEIAHIKAVSNFDSSATIAEINLIDNLIALCPNHHWEYDNGILKI